MAAFPLFVRQARNTGSATSPSRRFAQGVDATITVAAHTLDDLTPLGGTLTLGVEWSVDNTTFRQVAGFVANGVGSSAEIHVVAQPGWLRATLAISGTGIDCDAAGNG
jgi:hypothetical protein